MRPDRLAAIRKWLKENPASPDCSSWLVGGVLLTFSPTQSAVLVVLRDVAQTGTIFVRTAYVLEQVGSKMKANRIDVLFQRHPAWKTLVVRGPRPGMVGLNIPGID